MRKRRFRVAIISVSAVCFLLALGFFLLYRPGQPPTASVTSPSRRQLFDKFSDFNYATTLTRAQVVAMLGPPKDVDPPKDGFAECCTWRESFGPPLFASAYRLTLSFGSDDDVIAGGLYVDGKAQLR